MGAGDNYLDLNSIGRTGAGNRLVCASDVAATASIFLAASSGWTNISFGIAEAELTAVSGSVHTVLSNTTALRLYNSAALTFPGPSSVSTLGVDNITAAGVPVPGAWTMLAGGLAALLASGLRQSGQ